MSKRNRRPDKGKPGSRTEARARKDPHGNDQPAAPAAPGWAEPDPEGPVWLRIKHGVFGFDAPSLLADSRDIDLQGHDFAAEGFVRLTDPNQTVIPTAQRWGLDLSDRYNADIVHFVDGPSGPSTEMQFVAGGAFVDPHPDVWWKHAHTQGNGMVVVIGDPTPMIEGRWPAAGPQVWFASVWAARLPLTIRMWDSGVGTARPDQL